MSLDPYITSIMVVVFVASFFFAARRLKRDDSPRSLQRKHRWVFYYSLILFCVVATLPSLSGMMNYKFLIPWGLFVILTGYQAFKTPSDKDLLKNYAQDSGHCGQCGYDLTGNVSGVCPECSWAIPSVPPVVERAGWGMWWNRWDIEYLENWRRALVTTIFISGLFAVMTGYFIYIGNLLAVLPAFMCVQLAINSIRIAQYGRRQKG